ncbi:MAG: thioredoxin family protein [Akkermansiaceae bacterium]|nr:thioredoxin family protein [Verrucomicrobiales bacterium]
MKKFAFALLVCFAATLVQAADGEWLTDFAKAEAKARAENKLLFVEFTGSDWCPPCKALHKNVLATGEFMSFARRNLVLLEVDFPRRKPQSAALKAANKALNRKFNVEGYPTVIVLSPEGKELKKSVGYSGQDAKTYIAQLAKLRK